MIVMCEGCETSFNVEDRLIRPSGSRVRCSKCRHVFTAYPAPVELDSDEPLALENEVTPAPETDAQLKDIDSTLDALFNEEPAATAPADQDPELLDVDDLLAEDTPGSLAAGSLGDDLALDLDLGSLGGEPAPGAAPPATAALADFNLDIDPAGKVGREDDLLPDLDELEFNLDDLEQPTIDVPPAAAAAIPTADTGELELDLDFDAPIEPPALRTEATVGASSAAAPPIESSGRAGEDELDLSDLESMLADDTGQGQPVTRAATEGIDLELDLGSEEAPAPKPGEMEALDLTSIMPEPDAAPGPDGTTDAPDLGLLAELGEKAIPDAAASDELDFSDLAGILGEPGADTAKPAPAEPASELDLIFDDADTPAAAAAPPEAPAPSEDDLMLDLESLLEDGEQQEKAAAPAESTEELELDFAGADQRAESSELDIEIEPVAETSDLYAPLEQPASAAVAAGAAALAAASAAALGAKGKPLPAGVEASPSMSGELNMTGATGILESEPEPPPMPKKAVHRPAAPPSSGLRKVVLGSFAMLLLALLAFGIPRSLGIYVPFLSDADLPVLSELEIPGLGKVFEPVSDDPEGILKIAPLAESVTAEFVEHPALGRLCVVRGQLKNNYDHPRNYLQVTSKLLNQSREVAKTATVFAGNVLSTQELSALDLGAINARLKNRNGTANQNVGVKPGKAVPFMVVFNALPANLEEYSVEAAGSLKP
jgi:predicted Zn finger-like uncharacterized protein